MSRWETDDEAYDRVSQDELDDRTEAAREAYGHLGAALSQVTDQDDAIIIHHLRMAKELLQPVAFPHMRYLI